MSSERFNNANTPYGNILQKYTLPGVSNGVALHEYASQYFSGTVAIGRLSVVWFRPGPRQRSFSVRFRNGRSRAQIRGPHVSNVIRVPSTPTSYDRSRPIRGDCAIHSRKQVSLGSGRFRDRFFSFPFFPASLDVFLELSGSPSDSLFHGLSRRFLSSVPRSISSSVFVLRPTIRSSRSSNDRVPHISAYKFTNTLTAYALQCVTYSESIS